MQFNGKADPEFGGGKTQKKWGLLLALPLPFPGAEKTDPGGFGEEARLRRIQEILFPFLSSRHKR
jgi:hypothetical protein